jgi:uncharacterized protein (TIGR03435 family)
MLAHLADVSIRSLLLALIAGIVVWTLRAKRTAALQHAVWTVVVCGMLALFAFGQALPRLPLRVLDRPAAAPLQSPPPPRHAPLVVESVELPAPIPLARPRSIDWSSVAVYAYAAIAFGFLARFLTGTYLVSRLLAKSVAVGEFRESRLVAVPLTLGWLRPQILLPLEWREWDRGKLDTVLAHEGSHVRRRDGLVAALAGINRCIFWFHPLAWLLEKRLGLLAELACDEACIASLGDRDRYARLLLDMAGVVDGAHGRLQRHALTMAASSHIRQRIDSILKEGRQPSRGLTLTGWAAIALCGIPVVLGAGTLELAAPLPPLPLPGWKFTAPAPPPPRLLAQARSTSPTPSPTSRVKFEVASIRPGAPARAITGRGGEAPAAPPPGGPACAPVARTTMDAGRIDFVCISLKQLLLEAFAIPSGLLLAPDWTETDAFDISAKLPNGATHEQLPKMFQSLLEDRFGLTFHRGAKEGTVNALVVAKGGLKVRPAAPDSAQPAWVLVAAAAKAPYGYGRGARQISPGVFQSSSMGFVRRSDTGGPGGIIHYEAPSISSEGLAALARFAGIGMDPAVGIVDMTGLKGRYQVNLDVSMTDLFAAIAAGPRDAASMQGAWLNMVQDGLKKLGLQLEPRKAPVETIVVDHLEKTPTGN